MWQLGNIYNEAKMAGQRKKHKKRIKIRIEKTKKQLDKEKTAKKNKKESMFFFGFMGVVLVGLLVVFVLIPELISEEKKDEPVETTQPQPKEAADVTGETPSDKPETPPAETPQTQPGDKPETQPAETPQTQPVDKPVTPPTE